MNDANAEAARTYHERTKHSWQSVRRSTHRLEWDNRPHPFKEYAGVDAIPLPRELPRPDVSALDALAGPQEPSAHALALVDLARLLRWGAGVVRSRSLPGGDEYHFRTYSSAGALYPVEVYVACCDLDGVPAGLYHFHPRELALRRLRGADVRSALAAAADAQELARAGAVLVLTGILWRTAWKYQARGYRHLYWDAGTMLANLLALAASARLGARLLTAFVDGEVNRLVGVDGRREAALALLAVGEAPEAREAVALEELELTVAPLSRREREYAEAHALHEASSFASEEDVRRYRLAVRESAPVEAPPLPPSARGEPLEPVLRRRGSLRDFAPHPVPAADLADLLARAAAPIPADFPPTNAISLFANAVEELMPGIYRFRPPDGFDLVRPGNLRRLAGYLVLEQPLGALAAATCFLMADLEAVLGVLGDRGYRAAQLESGIRAGRLYVGAYALGWGATASTFYDDDVSRELETHEAPMLCVAVGRKP